MCLCTVDDVGCGISFRNKQLHQMWVTTRKRVQISVQCLFFMSFHINLELDFKWLMSFKPGNEIYPGIKICPKHTCESRSLICRCELYIFLSTFLAKDFQTFFLWWVTFLKWCFPRSYRCSQAFFVGSWITETPKPSLPRVQNPLLKREGHLQPWRLTCPKDHGTLKTGYFEVPTPVMQVQTLPLEGPRSLGWNIIPWRFWFRSCSFLNGWWL